MIPLDEREFFQAQNALRVATRAITGGYLELRNGKAPTEAEITKVIADTQVLVSACGKLDPFENDDYETQTRPFVDVGCKTCRHSIPFKHLLAMTKLAKSQNAVDKT